MKKMSKANLLAPEVIKASAFSIRMAKTFNESSEISP
jgi:hypothetical protein